MATRNQRKKPEDSALYRPIEIDVAREVAAFVSAKRGGTSGGRPTRSLIASIRARVMLRSAYRGLGIDRGALARRIDQQDPNGAERRLLSWERGTQPRESLARQVAEKWPAASDWWHHPMWALLDPRPIGKTELRRLMRRWLSPRNPPLNAQWALDPELEEPRETSLSRAIRSDIVALLGGDEFYPLLVALQISDLPFVTGPAERSFAFPDVEVLYLRGDVRGFVAMLALLREAQVQGWSDLFAWRAVYLVRSLPFLLRDVDLMPDARDLLDIVMAIVQQGRVFSMVIDVDVDVALRLSSDSSYQPNLYHYLFRARGLEDLLRDAGRESLLEWPRDALRFSEVRTDTLWKPRWSEQILEPGLDATE